MLIGRKPEQDESGNQEGDPHHSDRNINAELMVRENPERRPQHHKDRDQGLKQGHALLQLIRMNMLLEQLHNGRL
ncbi:hypothetical protein D1872_251150 [compost metagenome]